MTSNQAKLIITEASSSFTVSASFTVSDNRAATHKCTESSVKCISEDNDRCKMIQSDNHDSKRDGEQDKKADEDKHSKSEKLNADDGNYFKGSSASMNSSSVYFQSGGIAMSGPSPGVSIITNSSIHVHGNLFIASGGRTSVPITNSQIHGNIMMAGSGCVYMCGSGSQVNTPTNKSLKRSADGETGGPEKRNKESPSASDVERAAILCEEANANASALVAKASAIKAKVEAKANAKASALKAKASAIQAKAEVNEAKAKVKAANLRVRAAILETSKL